MSRDAIYFYGHTKPDGHFSNFKSMRGGFTHRGKVFLTSEHAFMWRKAQRFGDEATANRIEDAKTPAQAKALGRKVRPFDKAVWSAECAEVMEEILLDKFQVREFKDKLFATGSAQIYEAAPKDKIWGIGINLAAAEAGKPHKGKNLLGKALMRVRDRLRAGDAIEAAEGEKAVEGEEYR